LLKSSMAAHPVLCFVCCGSNVYASLTCVSILSQESSFRVRRANGAGVK
jgi:hypothetical protein